MKWLKSLCLFVPGVFIVAAKRTPFGKFGGLLRDLHPSDLLAAAAKDAIKAGNISPATIDTVNVGQVYVVSVSNWLKQK